MQEMAVTNFADDMRNGLALGALLAAHWQGEHPTAPCKLQGTNRNMLQLPGDSWGCSGALCRTPVAYASTLKYTALHPVMLCWVQVAWPAL
jgi:hypothetical protein